MRQRYGFHHNTGNNLRLQCDNIGQLNSTTMKKYYSLNWANFMKSSLMTPLFANEFLT